MRLEDWYTSGEAPEVYRPSPEERASSLLRSAENFLERAAWHLRGEPCDEVAYLLSRVRSIQEGLQTELETL